MTKRKRRSLSSRLERIERKCDIILSELLVLRKHRSRNDRDLDTAIDRLHTAARRMRERAVRELEATAMCNQTRRP